MDDRTLDAVLDDLAASDPRLDQRHLRVVPGRDGAYPVVLVGVVHDHPASIHRAGAVAAALDPDVLALELPALVVPLFERSATADEGYLRDDEMTAAIRAAPDARVAGLDVPDRWTPFVLYDELRDARASRRTLVAVLADVLSLTRHALGGRLLAAGLPMTALASGLDRRHEYPVSPADSPASQAAHETRHVRRSRSFLSLLDAPSATAVLDAARERTMVRRLAALRSAGSVLAVVGYEHLDPTYDALADGARVEK